MPKTEWQWHYLLRDHIEAATDAGTLRVKMPVREQISCIEVEAQAHVTTPNYNSSIIDALTKIEVIADGSKVLYSCIPEVAAFLHFAQIRSTPNIKRMDAEGEHDIYRVKICFGRYQRDEQYMLDTGQYNNVYLEIPWDLDVPTFHTLSMQWTIRYLRPIQRLSPVGFIRSRDIEYDQHVWTATGHYFVDLPLKYPWYTLGCRIYSLTHDMENLITHIKLDIDDGRLVLVDDDIDDLITIQTERLPYPVHVVHEQVHTSPAAAGPVRSYMGEIEEVTVKETSPEFKQITDSPVCGQRIVLKAGPSPGAGHLVQAFCNVSLWGTAYMCCIVIKDWMKTWFDPEPHAPFPVGAHSEADIDYTHGALTVTDLRTFLQEVCPLSI